MVTGQCLCGAVRFRVQGTLGDVLICHCEECRRWHGHVSATTAVARHELILIWDAPGNETISIAAGTLDRPTGVRVASHWFVSQSGDYYELPEDGLLRHERSGEGELS